MDFVPLGRRAQKPLRLSIDAVHPAQDDLGRNAVPMNHQDLRGKAANHADFSAVIVLRTNGEYPPSPQSDPHQGQD